jgi:hypothetical protein
MVGRLKFVIVWLLALAIPAQGLAAATMAHCGASHQRMHAAGAQAESHATDHHRQQHSHQHEAGAVRSADRHVAVSSHATTEPDKFSDLGQYKCGVCGSCCSAAAMPGFSLALPESAPVAQWEAVRFHAYIVFVTDGPDRPPRPILA